MHCPLCNETSIETVEKLAVIDITAIYSRTFGLDVADVFRDISEIAYCHCSRCDLFFFDPLAAGDEKFYTGLQRFEWYYPEKKNEFIYAAKWISETDSVLEIGSGKGAFANLISAKSYVGLEFSQTAKQLAEKNGVEIINQSIEDHALICSGKYDVVCSFQVLEHVSNPRAFIEAAVKCLRPGGRLILSVPSLDSFSRYVPNFSLDMPPHHVTRWTDLSLQNVAREMHLEVEDIWHEPLQEAHKLFYASAIFKNATNKILNLSPKMIDKSFFGRLTVSLSSIAGRIFSRGLTDTHVLPRGISVTAIYKKP